MNGGPQEAERSISHIHWLHVWGAVHWLVEVLTVTGIPPVNNLLPIYWVLTEKLACQIAKGRVVEMPPVVLTVAGMGARRGEVPSRTGLFHWPQQAVTLQSVILAASEGIHC